MNKKTSLNPQRIHFSSIFSLCLLLLVYGYSSYAIERAASGQLFIAYGLLFLLTYYFFQKSRHHLSLLAGAALLIRLCLLPALPWLSQDYFRFIWDGRLMGEGLNPYLFLPVDLVSTPGFSIPQAQELYEGMGSLSAGHYTNYPPLNQVLFYIGTLAGRHSVLATVIAFRMVILLADLGVFYFGRKILLHLHLNPDRIFWYLLNPLVVLELTGNLHFEGVMLFFLVWSFYLTLQHKWMLAAISMALSISVKLLPLLLLPVYFHYYGWKRSTWFYVLILVINLLLFMPFLTPGLIPHFSQSIGLWFTKFEFNASFYYLLREAGFAIKGYNIIQTTGKIMPILMVLFILLLSYFKKHSTFPMVLSSMTLLLAVYFFQSTTVHPWYIVNLVLLSVFTGYRFPLAWSFTVILSYFAYANPGNKENLWLIFLEYLPVYILFIWEVFNIRRPAISLLN